MRIGRPGRGVGHVKALEGSERAKHRLEVVLQTLTRFHVIRRESLQGALDELEARPVGRPIQGGEDEHTRELAERVAKLETELRRTQARADVAEGRLLFALREAAKGGARSESRRGDRGGGETKRQR